MKQLMDSIILNVLKASSQDTGCMKVQRKYLQHEEGDPVQTGQNMGLTSKGSKRTTTQYKQRIVVKVSKETKEDRQQC